MIGVRVWARWPWSLAKLVCVVRKRRAYRNQPEHQDIADPYREWRDHGDPVG